MEELLLIFLQTDCINQIIPQIDLKLLSLSREMFIIVNLEIYCLYLISFGFWYPSLYFYHLIAYLLSPELTPHSTWFDQCALKALLEPSALLLLPSLVSLRVFHPNTCSWCHDFRFILITVIIFMFYKKRHELPHWMVHKTESPAFFFISFLRALAK